MQELGKAHASEAGLREQMDDELRRSAFPELQAILAEHATKLRQLIESSNDVRTAYGSPELHYSTSVAWQRAPMHDCACRSMRCMPRRSSGSWKTSSRS